MIPKHTERYNQKNCAVCNEIFYVSKSKTKRRRKGTGLRPRNAVTCSHDCSQKYSKKQNITKGDKT